MSPLPVGPGRAALTGLRPSPENPRSITPDALERLQHTLAGAPELLEARPLICDTEGVVIAGNQRLAAASALGWEMVPVHVVDPTAAERREITLLDNSQFGRWDDEKLAALVADHAREDADMRMLGFNATELAALQRLAEPAVPAPPRAAPAPPSRTVVGFDREEITALLNASARVGHVRADALDRARAALQKALDRLTPAT